MARKLVLLLKLPLLLSLLLGISAGLLKPVYPAEQGCLLVAVWLLQSKLPGKLKLLEVSMEVTAERCHREWKPMSKTGLQYQEKQAWFPAGPKCICYLKKCKCNISVKTSLTGCRFQVLHLFPEQNKLWITTKGIRWFASSQWPESQTRSACWGPDPLNEPCCHPPGLPTRDTIFCFISVLFFNIGVHPKTSKLITVVGLSPWAGWYIHLNICICMCICISISISI